jgi:hypothetical protein
MISYVMAIKNNCITPIIAELEIEEKRKRANYQNFFYLKNLISEC